ncbi:MAG: hypothetical protein AB7N76_14280 [Planctomycetota bacterium]
MKGRLFLGDGVGNEHVEVHAVGDQLVVERGEDQEPLHYSLLQAQVMLGGDRGGYLVFRIHGLAERVEVWVERNAVLWFLREGRVPPQILAQVEALLARDGRARGMEMIGLFACSGAFLLFSCGGWAIWKLGFLAFL